MPQETPSPVDLPERAPGRPALGWTTVTIALAALLLLATNAMSLSDWADDLPPGPVQARIAGAADQWRQATDAVGLGAPRAWLHGWWQAAEAARF